MHAVFRLFLATSIGTLVSSLLAGCGSYVLRGRVIEGATSNVTLVDINDTMVTDAENFSGVSGATVSLVRDPSRLNRAEVASSSTSPDGYFVLPVREFGAGWMEETWEIRASAPGRLNAVGVVHLPASSNGVAVLIITQEGRQPRLPDDDDPMDIIQRYK